MKSKRLIHAHKLLAATLVFLLATVGAVTGITVHHYHTKPTATVRTSTEAQKNTDTASDASAGAPATTPTTDSSSQSSATDSSAVSIAPSTPTNTTSASITHPTANDCLPDNQTFTVYASLNAGTPAYKDDPNFRDSSGTVLYTVPYQQAITNVFCGKDKDVLFYYVGRQIYASFHFSDVSLTQP